MPPPPNPCIYHITHVDNLPKIIAAGELWSDARTLASGPAPVKIGMSKLKQRRLTLPVHGHTGLCVGDCVPFYFCPRSVMLYLLHKGNHAEITYTGGQDPIVHLEADLHGVVAWLNSARQRWAFSLGNAAAYMADFRTSMADIGDIDWAAVGSTSWSNVREAKQAEFLAEDSFPWSLVQRIGVRSQATATKVHAVLAGCSHKPAVVIQPSWYY